MAKKQDVHYQADAVWPTESSGHQQILTKAITKAIDGGWKPRIAGFADDDWDAQMVAWFDHSHERFIYADEVWAEIIYNHDFAKALWGERIMQSGLKDGDAHLFTTFAWKAHLIKMVIADDPIKYLGENI